MYDKELAARLREELAAVPNVTEKAMFGGLAFLVNGNMAVSASGRGGLLLRIDPAESAELVARTDGVERFAMRGREMDGWLRVDPSVVVTDDALAVWVAYGVRYASALPPK